MALEWNHNSWYHPFVLRRVAGRPGACPGRTRMLDLGCGSGRLAARLAAHADHVDAIDVDPQLTELARRRVPPTVTVTVADGLTWLAEHPSAYDAILSVSTLHHLPTAAALGLSAAALKPGGRFIAMTHVRRRWPHDLPAELMATTVHHAVGVGLLLKERLTGREPLVRRHSREDREHGMRLAEPAIDADELRRIVAVEMAEATVRRLALWRFAVVWTKPGPG